jgi:hypothetical protein
VKERILTKQLNEAVNALQHLAICELNEHNCADLQVATKRIRNVARLALNRIKEIEREEGK